MCHVLRGGIVPVEFIRGIARVRPHGVGLTDGGEVARCGEGVLCRYGRGQGAHIRLGNYRAPIDLVRYIKTGCRALTVVEYRNGHRLCIGQRPVRWCVDGDHPHVVGEVRSDLEYTDHIGTTTAMVILRDVPEFLSVHRIHIDLAIITISEAADVAGAC